jgi:hypothetical protein
MRYRARSNRAPAPAFFAGDSAIRPFNGPPLMLAELDAAHVSYLEVARYVEVKRGMGLLVTETIDRHRQEFHGLVEISIHVRRSSTFDFGGRTLLVSARRIRFDAP